MTGELRITRRRFVAFAFALPALVACAPEGYPADERTAIRDSLATAPTRDVKIISPLQSMFGSQIDQVVVIPPSGDNDHFFVKLIIAGDSKLVSSKYPKCAIVTQEGEILKPDLQWIGPHEDFFNGVGSAPPGSYVLKLAVSRTPYTTSDSYGINSAANFRIWCGHFTQDGGTFATDSVVYAATK